MNAKSVILDNIYSNIIKRCSIKKENLLMNGNAQKLIKYMDGASKRFIIPVYQRNYDWKMEHCKQLYDDLVKVIRQNRKSHFFGSIVSVQSEAGTMRSFLLLTVSSA